MPAIFYVGLQNFDRIVLLNLWKVISNFATKIRFEKKIFASMNENIWIIKYLWLNFDRILPLLGFNLSPFFHKL